MIPAPAKIPRMRISDLSRIFPIPFDMVVAIPGQGRLGLLDEKRTDPARSSMNPST